MDFLKIRKKAKERARAGRSPVGAASAVEPAPGTPAPAAQPPGSARAAAVELAATLEELPDPRDADPRFTTWRPGTGERPLPETQRPAPPAAPPAERGADDPTRLRGVAPPAARPSDLPPAQPRPAAPPHQAPPPPIATRDPLDDFFYREDEQVSAVLALPADDQPAPASGPEEAGVEEYLTFRLGVEEYAVDIERVREVLKCPPISEVPRAPAGVLGVVTVRGDVVAVFDPRWRLGLPGTPPAEGAGRIVIVDNGQGPCGLLVDSVASVVRLARGSIEPCPQGIGGASADCLAGIGRERSRLFTVLELGALLRPAPARAGRGAHAGA